MIVVDHEYRLHACWTRHAALLSDLLGVLAGDEEGCPDPTKGWIAATRGHGSPTGTAGIGLEPAHAGRVRQQRMPQRLRAIARDGDADALALVTDRRADEKRGLAAFPFQLPREGKIHEPVAMDAEERSAEGGLDGGERKIDVEPALTGVHEAQPLGGLERPDLRRVEEDEVPLAPRDHAEQAGTDVRPPLVEPAQALLDTFLTERLQQVVGDAEIERLQGMLAEGGGQHEQGARDAVPRVPVGRRVGRRSQRLDELEAILSARELHVDEDHVDRERRQHFPRLSGAGDRADHLGQLRRLDEVHEVIARRPFVLEHQGAEAGHERASSMGISTIERVPEGEDSSRNLARSAYCSASRRRTECKPKPPGRAVPSGSPGPLSSTVQTSVLASTSAARTSIVPPSLRPSAPCLTAFSTSGCRRSRGRSAPRVPAPTSQRKAR